MTSGEKKQVEGVLVLKEKKSKPRKKKTTISAPRRKGMGAKEREELLIENFVGLQKAMVNLSMKFENLSDNISKLLNVFEISARDFMVNKGKSSPDIEKELIGRLNMMIEQNKAVLGSVRSMDEKLRKQDYSKPQSMMSQPIQPSQNNSSIPAGMQQSEYPTQSKPKTIVQTI